MGNTHSRIPLEIPVNFHKGPEPISQPTKLTSLAAFKLSSFVLNFQKKHTYQLSFSVSTLKKSKLTVFEQVKFSYPDKLKSNRHSTFKVSAGIQQEFSTKIKLPKIQKPRKSNRCPLVLRLQCQDQITTLYIGVDKFDQKFDVKVLKQSLEVGGEFYDLVNVFSASGNCIVCLWEAREILVFPCKHLCLCWKCAELIMSGDEKCPVCRGDIESFQSLNN